MKLPTRVHFYDSQIANIGISQFMPLILLFNEVIVNFLINSVHFSQVNKVWLV